MTEEERIAQELVAQEAVAEVFSEATSNAYLYGIGMIKITYINGGMEVSAVTREEYRETADELIWIDNNAHKETKQ
jgi:hypothetical protein